MSKVSSAENLNNDNKGTAKLGYAAYDGSRSGTRPAISALPARFRERVVINQFVTPALRAALANILVWHRAAELVPVRAELERALSPYQREILRIGRDLAIITRMRSLYRMDKQAEVLAAIEHLRNDRHLPEIYRVSVQVLAEEWTALCCGKVEGR